MTPDDARKRATDILHELSGYVVLTPRGTVKSYVEGDTEFVAKALLAASASPAPAQAEIERLRGELSTAASAHEETAWQLRSVVRERDEARANVARLEEAYDRVCRTMRGVEHQRDDHRAALATAEAREREAWTEVREALTMLAEADEDSGHYINEGSHANALFYADALEAAHYPAPKIWSHGGDAVVFSWRDILNLTISDEPANHAALSLSAGFLDRSRGAKGGAE